MTKPWKPVRKKSLADAVFDDLRDRILSGDISPGETLPSERNLADKLDVNRGAVREALKRLEQARLISIRHGGSTRVLDFRQTAGTDLLSSLLVDDAGRLDLEVARSVIEMRSALAPSIARLCARRGQTVVDELDDVVEEMQEADDDLDRLQMASLEFWGAMVSASGNIAYELAFNSLRESYTHFAHILTSAMADEFAAIDDYRALRDAIADGDEALTAECALRIIHRGESALTAVIDGIKAQE